MTERLTAEGIEANVKLIVGAYVGQVKTPLSEVDKAVIEASSALIINVLINLNDIAYAQHEGYYDALRKG